VSKQVSAANQTTTGKTPILNTGGGKIMVSRRADSGK
jgi:hypothetical protein